MRRENVPGEKLSPAEELARIPLYEKGKPPQPLIHFDFADEIEIASGRRWGAQSELGTLRSVMVQPPTSGPVSAPVVLEDPIFFGWRDTLLDTDCQSTTAADGADRCQPLHIRADQFYADAASGSLPADVFRTTTAVSSLRTTPISAPPKTTSVRERSVGVNSSSIDRTCRFESS